MNNYWHASPNLSILLYLLNVAEIPLSALRGKTLLAPSNAAFRKLPQSVFQALLKPENREVLKQILFYHVVDPNNSNLAGEPYPQIINLDQVLIPPSLQPTIERLIEQATLCQTCTVPVPNCYGNNCYKAPWMRLSKATNNL